MILAPGKLVTPKLRYPHALNYTCQLAVALDMIQRRDSTSDHSTAQEITATVRIPYDDDERDKRQTLTIATSSKWEPFTVPTTRAHHLRQEPVHHARLRTCVLSSHLLRLPSCTAPRLLLLQTRVFRVESRTYPHHHDKKTVL